MVTIDDQRTVHAKPLIQCGCPNSHRLCPYKGESTPVLECKAPYSYYIRCIHQNDEEDDNDD